MNKRKHFAFQNESMMICVIVKPAKVNLLVNRSIRVFKFFSAIINLFHEQKRLFNTSILHISIEKFIERGIV